jgi:hypothetical protein
MRDGCPLPVTAAVLFPQSPLSFLLTDYVKEEEEEEENIFPNLFVPLFMQIISTCPASFLCPFFLCDVLILGLWKEGRRRAEPQSAI